MSVEQLAQSIFKKPLTECSETELRRFTDEFPYFAPAQLLLSRYLLDNELPGSAEQIQTTSLYFPNRLWLGLILDTQPSVLQAAHAETYTAGQFMPAADDAVISDQPLSLADPEPVTAPGLEKIIPGIQPAELEADTVQDLFSASESSVEEAPIPEESSPDQQEDYRTESTAFADTPTVESEIETREEELMIPDSSNPSFEMTGPEPEAASGGTQPADYPIAEDMNATISRSASAAAEEAASIPEPVSKADLVFEPYHTVDYFASQGIRFRDDDKARDRFSQQLRSFTEWLKVMKRIPPAELAVGADAVTEKKVEQLAEHSLAERHVITEAMAEVWIKQGNRARAEEIYRKLSLLDPSKSSYFAARIEELKK